MEMGGVEGDMHKIPKPKRFGHLLRPAVGVPVGLGQTGTPTAGNKFRNLLHGCLYTHTFCT